MTIARIIEARRSAIISCDAAMRVENAIGLLAEKRIGALPVLRGGRVMGIFSERDVLYGLAEEGPALLDREIGEVMTAPPVTVDPETPIISALALMTRRRIRHLPVVRGEAMVGFVSIGDLVKHRIDRIESEADAMRAYIQTA